LEIGHKLTLNQVTFIMLIVTLTAPMAIFWHGGGYDGSSWHIYISIIAITWVYLPPDQGITVFGISSGGFIILNPAVILTTSIFWVFHALFALYVIRYYQERISKRSVLLIGGFTLLLPLMNTIQALEFLWRSELIVYIGPIPIQLILGLLLIRLKTREKDVTTEDTYSSSEPW
jgi:hypothetical protein